MERELETISYEKKLKELRNLNLKVIVFEIRII